MQSDDRGARGHERRDDAPPCDSSHSGRTRSPKGASRAPKRHREDELSRVEGWVDSFLSSRSSRRLNASLFPQDHYPLVFGKATNSNNKGWLYRVIKARYMNPEVEGREDVTAEEDGTAAARPRRRKRVDYLAVVSAGAA